MKRTHGYTVGGKARSIYSIWADMRQRCRNPSHHAYARYGGRGITVCDRWSAFENFLNDMGERPTPQHSIDRVDNDKGYFPENCRWATWKEQNMNRRLYQLATNNRSGLTGVVPRFSKRKGREFKKWYAFGKRETLYIGPDLFEAACARKSWELHQ